jgi:transcriptional regulator with XRE-family HTH domain
MDLVAKEWGVALRRLRRKLRLSQTQVAQMAGKTQSQIARMEQGLGDPRLSSVVQVSRSLGTEMIAVPIRLLPAVRNLLAEYEPGASTSRPSRLAGNDPEDLNPEDMEQGDDEF